MLLKRLVLHGFKTFATRAIFEFPGGVTAVIGPNGSGKSNLADAVRWVLGETGQAALRARRGEDVIFAGSSARPAMGMAEVSLTLDNGQRVLDSDFAEIEITRRVFRDGEHHYLINGTRVRLRDVQALTAPLGGAYTVVGQGLVDAALSQRSEDRRGLFEHAANISAHQLKRAEAERRLAAAEANCQRLTDILAELAPRVKALERQARQAAEAATLQARLEEHLQHYHGRLWRVAAAAVTAAEEEAAARAATVAAHQQEIDRLVRDQAAARARVQACQTTLETARRERGHLARALAEAVRQAAVAGERVAAINRRLQDDGAARATLEDRRRRLAEALAAASARAPEIEAAWQRARAEHAATETALAERERALGTAADEARALHDALLEGTARAGQLDTSLARATDTLARLDLAERHAAAEAERTVARQATLLKERAAVTAALQAARQEIAALDGQRDDLTAARATAEATLADLGPRLTTLEHDLTAAQARLEALTRLRDSGAGLAGGPRAVQAAARRGQLDGVVGLVASLVRAPAHLDTALEVALGGHLQDVVVERWADAEAAVALLKRTNAGRATFLPLDTLRPVRPVAPRPAPASLGWRPR